MKKLLVFPAIIFLASAVFAQKGVDTQTKKIKQEATKTTQSSGDAGSTATSTGRVLDFGKGKTPTRQLLPNPYKLNGRRDVLIQTIVEELKERKLTIDEASSKISEGIIVTQPFVFARGVVLAQNELSRYAILPADLSGWSSGRYSLRVEVESIDGIQNNVYVTAKVDGKSSGLVTQWTDLQSSGMAEDEFLSKLVEEVTGSPVTENVVTTPSKP